jgi:hypothetical protein
MPGVAIAQTSEIDGYDRAVSLQTKEAALAFLREFRSSHLVGDLIESLRPDLAREVCSDLPDGIARARRACEQRRQTAAADAVATSGTTAAALPAQPAPTAEPSAPEGSIRSLDTPVQRAERTTPTVSDGKTSIEPPVMQPATTNVLTPATIGDMAAPEEFVPAAGGQPANAADLAMKSVTASPNAVAIPSFHIEFFSAKSRADAESAWQDLQMAYPDLLRDLQFSVLEVDLGAAGGVAYRGVVRPLPSRDEASVLCIVIRASPPYGDCAVAQD